MSGQHDHPAADATGDEKSEGLRQASPGLDQKIQDAIGRSLRAHYDDLVSAPVPDRLLALLAELEAKEGGHGS